ncbi:MAG: adenylate kinase [Ruminococcaceae bacterium]|nr:adenylate kinase [Oscillospiraceae bacterium]
MNLIFLGAPGAGKGTQSVAVAEILNIPHISTGDIFRYNIKEGTPLGKEADSYISKGQLVPDDLTVSIVVDRLNKDDCKDGFILDGFPRTIYQAEALDKFMASVDKKIDYAVNIQVDEDSLVDRLSKRRFCPACSGTFHVDYTPLTSDDCPTCGAKLIQRKDDTPEVIKERLETYHEKTAPLTDYYSEKGCLLNVEGVPGIEKSLKNTLTALGIEK